MSDTPHDDATEAALPRPRPPIIDWTLTPAKTGAVAILALLGAMGLAWSIIRTEGGPAPAPIEATAALTTSDAPITPIPFAAAHETTTTNPILLGDISSIGSQTDARPASPETAALETQQPEPSIAEPVVTLQPSAPSADPPPPDPAIAQRININTATVDELQLLPGIGPSRAAAILADRQTHGPFRSIDDLERVRGIGPAIINALRDFARTR